MPNTPGETVFPGDDTHTQEADGSASAGDALAIDQSSGKATQGQDDTTPDIDQFAGVAPADFGEDGDKETIVRHGAPVAKVAADISAGERLDLSATAGELASTDGGPVLALSDEGGEHPTTGVSIPDGYAVVDF